MATCLAHARERAFRHQQGCCHYCGLSMLPADAKTSSGRPHRLACTAEHLQARCDGGSNAAANIVAAHRFCNLKRHQRSTPLAPENYRAHVLRRMDRGAWHTRGDRAVLLKLRPA